MKCCQGTLEGLPQWAEAEAVPISAQIQGFDLASVNQPGTSALLSPPTFFFFFFFWTPAQHTRLVRLFLKSTATTGRVTLCIQKKKKGKLNGKKHILQRFMTPVNKTSIYRCAMFTSARFLSYKKLHLVILNHLSESIAHYATLLAQMLLWKHRHLIFSPPEISYF